MTKTIAISSGHGRLVSGAIGQIKEVEEARKVVDKVTTYLKQLDIKVWTFHDDTSKTQRDNVNTIVKYHNSKARDLDVSLHFNAATRTDDPRGVEVLYYSDNNKKLAEETAKSISKASGLKNRGAKKRDNLGFLKGTSKPSVLIEVCFVDSQADVQAYQKSFDLICRAIAETISGKKLSVAKVDTSESKQYHTVVKGDTVSKIAKQYGSTLAKIKSWNKLDDEYTIMIG